MSAPAGKRTPHKWIEQWDDERSMGNSLIVSLLPGRKFSDDPPLNEHVRGFDTAKEALRAVRHETMPCDCLDCSRATLKA